jgi:hypothetical protein
MEYKFTGDVTLAIAAIKELQAARATLGKDEARLAKEAAKGNDDARKSLLEVVKAKQAVIDKINEATRATQNFQKASELAAKSQSSGVYALADPTTASNRNIAPGAGYGLGPITAMDNRHVASASAAAARAASLQQSVTAFEQMTVAATRFQAVSEKTEKFGWFTKPNMQQMSAAMIGLSFGIDDFVQQWAATGKLSEGLRAAGNNLTMLASLFGPVAVVGTATATALAVSFARSNEKIAKAKKTTDEYKKSLEELAKLEVRRFGSEKEGEYVAMVKASRAADTEARKARAASKADPQDVPKLQAAEKAEEAARTARFGLEEATKERAQRIAAEKYAGAKDEIAEQYKRFRAAGMGKAAAEEAAFGEARKFATGDKTELQGLRKFISKIGEETESELTGKAIGRGLQDPAIKNKEELQAKIEARELALHEFERGADADRRGQNRRRLGRDERHDIEARKEEIQLLRDQLKVQERQLEETKRAREEKLSKVVVPKGIGDAGK